MDEVVIQGFGPSRLRFWNRQTHPWDRRVFFTVSMIHTMPDQRTLEPRVPGVTNYADGTALPDFLDGLDPTGWEGARVWMSCDRDIAVTATFTDQIQLTWRIWSKKDWNTEMTTPLPPGTAGALRDFLTGPEPAVPHNGVRWGDRTAARAGLNMDLFVMAWKTALDLTGAGTGTALLDLACGSGEFCGYATDRGADVIGIDTSHELIARAEETAPTAEFHVWPLERLPWHDRTFDVVTAFNGLCYAQDPLATFDEAVRVSKNYVIVCGWHPRLPSDLLTVARTVHGPRPFTLPQLPAAHELLKVESPLEYPDEETMLRSLLNMTSFQHLIRLEGEDVVAEKVKVATAPFRRRVADNLRYSKPDQTYRLENTYLMQVFRV